MNQILTRYWNINYLMLVCRRSNVLRPLKAFLRTHFFLITFYILKKFKYFFVFKISWFEFIKILTKLGINNSITYNIQTPPPPPSSQTLLFQGSIWVWLPSSHIPKNNQTVIYSIISSIPSFFSTPPVPFFFRFGYYQFYSFCLYLRLWLRFF